MESWTPLILMIGVVAFVGYHILMGMFDGYSGAGQKQMICQSCGTTGQPRIETKGSIAVEIILWLCLLVPGLIYSVWRLSSKHPVCPACGSTGMIGTDTPRGQQLVKQFKPQP